MAIDERLTIDLEYVLAIELQCPGCQTTLAIPSSDIRGFEIACANCRTSLLPRQDDKENTPVRNLSDALRGLLAEARKTRVLVRLQIRTQRGPAS